MTGFLKTWYSYIASYLISETASLCRVASYVEVGDFAAVPQLLAITLYHNLATACTLNPIKHLVPMVAIYICMLKVCAADLPKSLGYLGSLAITTGICTLKGSKMTNVNYSKVIPIFINLLVLLVKYIWSEMI